MITQTPDPTTPTDPSLVNQAFLARPATVTEGTNYVVAGPAAGVVAYVATTGIDFAQACAKRFQAEWDAADQTQRHELVCHKRYCERCLLEDLARDAAPADEEMRQLYERSAQVSGSAQTLGFDEWVAANQQPMTVWLDGQEVRIR